MDLYSIRRSGQARHLMLFVLLPIIMMSGIVAVNAAFDTKAKAKIMMATDAPSLCVVEDTQKMCIVIFGAFAGSAVGLLFRIQEDADFAKRTSTMRRISYMAVSAMTSACCTPYLVMNISESQSKALCLIMGMAFALGAWIALEIFYTRVKAYAIYLLDKFLPVPKDAGTDKAKNPPAS